MQCVVFAWRHAPGELLRIPNVGEAVLATVRGGTVPPEQVAQDPFLGASRIGQRRFERRRRRRAGKPPGGVRKRGSGRTSPR